jgi:hypothetical protein
MGVLREFQEALLMEFFEEASLRRVEKRVPPDGSVSSQFANHSLQTLPPTMNPA